MGTQLNSTLKIHLAGTYPGGLRRAAAWTSLDDHWKQVLFEYPYLLESYHYIGKNDKFTDEIRGDGKTIFLDSGAFSMFTQGIKVDVKKYSAFIKRNQDVIEVASVLDGIGDPKLTLENQGKLETMGVNVLPCFHYGEPVSYLKHYIEHYDHITLGGMVPISTKDLRTWLDEIWDQYLTDDEGKPIIKVHGFGLTVLELMFRYPWYSVDSTSWVMTGRFGSIYWPLGNNRETKLTISDQSPKTKEFGLHYDSMAPYQQLHAKEIIEAKGFTVNELRTEYWKRDLWNILYFRELCNRPQVTFKKQEMGLF